MVAEACCFMTFKQINWNNYLKRNQNDPHQSFELLDQYLINIVRKRKLLKNSKYLYQTKGILKSIKVKNKTSVLQVYWPTEKE